jgi:hypothetical protein
MVGATGTISKSFRKYLRNIPGKHEIRELQKTAKLGAARTSEGTNRFNIRNSAICTIQNSCSTVFSRDMVCFRTKMMMIISFVKIITKNVIILISP